MRREIAERWADALESGEYVQGQSYLKTHWPKIGTYHCCLGVLCELAVKDGVDLCLSSVAIDGQAFFSDEGKELRICKTEFDEADALLPDAVVRWAGMDSRIGVLPPRGVCLIELNDGGCSFKDIAETIRRKWEGL